MPHGFVIGDRGLGGAGDSHPLWMMGHARAAPYLVAGASAVGQIHLTHYLPRDDAFSVRAAGPWLAAVVADGVGSRPLSRYGASYVVDALSALLLRPLLPPPRPPGHGAANDPARGTLAPPPQAEEVEFKASLLPEPPRTTAGREQFARAWQDHFEWERQKPPFLRLLHELGLQQAASLGWWPDGEADPASANAPAPGAPDETADLMSIMRAAFDRTYAGLREHAVGLGLDLSDLGCTALALLLHRPTGRGAAAQIGDGALLGLSARGTVHTLVHPVEADDPQSVYTLNKPNYAKYLTISLITPPANNPYQTFYLMTDGLSGDLLYSSTGPEEWARSVDHNLRDAPSPAQAAAGLLNWLAAYQVAGSWDDRTLVVITRQARDHEHG